MPVFPLCRNQTLNGLKGRGTNFTWYEKDVKQFFSCIGDDADEISHDRLPSWHLLVQSQQ